MEEGNTQASAGRAEAIRDMFGLISPRYDLANTVLSAGIHHRWRRRVVQLSRARVGARVLDCATGTGDLAFEFERRLGAESEIVATDFCAPMLERAIAKGQARGSRARFQEADVLALPFDTASFDVASIAFGIRNVADPQRGLAELGRVVRPGGTVMVLEFGQPRSAALRRIYGTYSRRILPAVGGWISGRTDAYAYLERSSAIFPCGDDFLQLALSTGLYSGGDCTPLTFGIAYVYRLRRQERAWP